MTRDQIFYAVDYDGTFSRDPELFAAIIRMIWARGDWACIVTGRDESHQIDDIHINLLWKKLPIFYAGAVYKRDFMDAQGIKIDVWIDDDPGSIAPGNFPAESPDEDL